MKIFFKLILFALIFSIIPVQLFGMLTPFQDYFFGNQHDSTSANSNEEGSDIPQIDAINVILSLLELLEKYNGEFFCVLDKSHSQLKKTIEEVYEKFENSIDTPREHNEQIKLFQKSCIRLLSVIDSSISQTTRSRSAVILSEQKNGYASIRKRIKEFMHTVPTLLRNKDNVVGQEVIATREMLFSILRETNEKLFSETRYENEVLTHSIHSNNEEFKRNISTGYLTLLEVYKVNYAKVLKALTNWYQMVNDAVKYVSIILSRELSQELVKRSLGDIIDDIVKAARSASVLEIEELSFLIMPPDQHINDQQAQDELNQELVQAVVDGNEQRVEELIMLRADVDIWVEDRPLLHVAYDGGNVQIAEAILAR